MRDSPGWLDHSCIDQDMLASLSDAESWDRTYVFPVRLKAGIRGHGWLMVLLQNLEAPALYGV